MLDFRPPLNYDATDAIYLPKELTCSSSTPQAAFLSG
jgi:hypothetical protein